MVAARAIERLLDLDHDVIALRAGARHAAPVSRNSSGTLVERATVPLVLDADAINVFAEEPDGWSAGKSATSSSRRTQVKWRAWSE